MKILGKAVLVAAAAMMPLPTLAQQVPLTISAAHPQGIVEVMRFAGYEAELTTDDVGDPMIDSEFASLIGVVMFYGCHEETHQGCDSIQLRVGLDREEPMTAEWMNNEFANDRYYGVTLDDEGDPWFNWDIITGNGGGIPTQVFLLALNKYSAQVGAASAVVFAEEREKEVNLGSPQQQEPNTT